jgi:hypothetical protein
MLSSPLPRELQPTGDCNAKLARAQSSNRVAGATGRTMCRGHVSIAITRVAAGLLLQREEVPAQGPRTLVVAVFKDLASFARWCDDDPIRFDQPLLLHQLRRDGDELWQASPKT